MSKPRSPLVFKFASEDWEFELIHRLNYRTFVEEIPQHQASPRRNGLRRSRLLAVVVAVGKRQ